MDTFSVDIDYSGVNFKAEFTGKVNILSSPSGTGKTFLLHAIESFCLNQNIEYSFYNCRYCILDEESIKNLCKDSHVVLLDNADLYLTNELLSWFKTQNMVVLICMKNTSHLDMEGVIKYAVDYKDQRVRIEEF